jgi:hypothetical protein
MFGDLYRKEYDFVRIMSKTDAEDLLSLASFISPPIDAACPINHKLALEKR